MKNILKILLLLFILVTIKVCFGQSITFKKVYPAFPLDPYRFSIECKTYNNDNNFLIFAAGMRIIKVDKTGEIVTSIDYLDFGSKIHSYIKDDLSFIFYSNHGINKKLLILDTALNILSAIHQYDSIDVYWQFGLDQSIINRTFDNGFILSGNYYLNPNGYHLNPLFFKTDSLGNILWSKYFSPMLGGIQNFIQIQDSGFVIAVNLENAAACLIKTDKNGDVLWAKSYMRPRGYIHNVLENDDGSLIITGNTDSMYAGTNSSPLFFIKLDESGNVIWAKTFGDVNNNIMNYPTDTKRTEDGGYITIATQANPIPNEDLIMIKLDANGDTLWVRAHGSPQSWEFNQSIEQLNDRGYIVCGSTNNNIPVDLSSLYLIRTDSLGHTDSLCEEYSPTIAINNITVNDSDLTVISVPFTITTSIPDTSTQNFTTYAYDGCHLDEIPELYAEQTAPLLIYPNPNNGKFQVSSPKFQASRIEIYNMLGEKVYFCSTDESLTDIDLTGNARGLYFVRMSNERFVKTGKVMVY